MTDTYVPGGRWRLWDQFALRGAGFPAGGVLRLAPDGLAAAADKFEPGEGPGALAGERWGEFTALFAEAQVEVAHTLQEIAASARSWSPTTGSGSASRTTPSGSSAPSAGAAGTCPPRASASTPAPPAPA